jgi:hypothetical protein
VTLQAGECSNIPSMAGLTLALAGDTLRMQLGGVYVGAITVLLFSHRELLHSHLAPVLQMCPRPEVVEVWDVTSPDPRLLVWLKVRRHYCQVAKCAYRLICLRMLNWTPGTVSMAVLV